MNSNNIEEILKDIFGMSLLDAKKIENEIIYNFNEVMTKLDEYKIFYTGDVNIMFAIKVIENYIVDSYNRISSIIINNICLKYFGKNIEMTLASEDINKIKLVFERYCKLNNYPIELQNKIMSDIEEKAIAFSKRFTFDDISLINLIEAAKGSNIVREEASDRNAILAQSKEKGTYHFKEMPRIKITPDMTEEEKKQKIKEQEQVFTIGGKIPEPRSEENRLEKNKIFLKSYPGYSAALETRSRDEIMKELIGNLFDNLNLCYDTYQKYYLDGNNKAIENDVELADGTIFPFKYVLDTKRIPHILGIPKAEYLSEKVRKVLGLSESAGADKVLLALIKNQKYIIADGGLIEENGKVYQMLPWEKIILKTSSFMRGDYFKTCFCLVKLKEGHYLEKPNEEYATIAATRYGQDFINKKLTITGILNDLILTKKQSKDFIFSGFLLDDKTGMYVPDTLITGKAENIKVGKDNEKLLTLQKYRKIFGDNDGCQVVKRIMNENEDRQFTPEEQALVHLTTSSSLGLPAKVSEEAIELEFSIQQEIEQILKTNLEELINPSNQKRR